MENKKYIEQLIKKAQRFEGQYEREYTGISKAVDYTQREVGDEWIDEHGVKCIQKEGYIKRVKKGGNIMSLQRCKCGKLVKNHNDKLVFYSTGKCIKCHAKQEQEDYLNGVEFKRPEWEKEILFKDSFGNPIFSIEDIIESYDTETVIKVLEKLKNSIIKMREAGKSVNQTKLNRIIETLNELKNGSQEHSASDAETQESKS